MSKLILVRHGQSTYNLENRFTGWKDVELTEQGKREAVNCASLLESYTFNVAYTSVLKRAKNTLEIIMDNMNHKDIYIYESQALNERDYGDLVGQNKKEAAQEHGEEQVQIWRRSYDTPPPGGESLKMTAERTLPYFKEKVLPHIYNGENVILSAHGNSIRSIVMELLKFTPNEILKTEIGWCEPWIFTFNDDLKLSEFEILKDPSRESNSFLPKEPDFV